MKPLNIGNSLLASTCTAAWLLLLTLVAGASPATGPLRVHAANPRYFADPGGNPVFLTGSHTWGNFQDYRYASLPSPAPMDFEAYLQFLEQHHHNFFRLWVWETAMNANAKQGTIRYEPMPYERPGPGTARDGNLRFDLTRWNPAYFERLRTRVKAARDHGIYASLMLFNGFSIEGKGNVGGDPWTGHPFNPSNNINGLDGISGVATHTLSNSAVTAFQEAYVRKVIDTVNDLQNVLYEISNEDSASPANADWQFHMIRFINSYEATKSSQHPVGMTANWPGTDDVLYQSPAAWVSPAAKLPAGDGRKIILNDTDHSYFWIGLKQDGPAAQRAWVWENFTRGNQCLFMDPYLDPSHDPGRNAPASGKPDPYWDSLREAMGQTRRYAEKMHLAAAVPHDELASTTFCLAAPGKEYLVFLPHGGEVTVDLSAAAGRLSVEWSRPDGGTVLQADPVEGGAKRSLQAPFTGEAVLYLSRTGVTAIRADDFLNSIGIVSAISRRGEDLANTINAARHLGLRWFRSGYESGVPVADLIELHKQTGVRFSYGFLSGGADLPRLLEGARQLASAGALLALEGNNEPNNWGITYEGERGGRADTWLPVAKLQQALYRAVKSDPVLKDYPVWSISENGAETDNVGLQFLTIPTGAGTLMPDGTKYADFANCHNYMTHPSWAGLHENQTWVAADPTSACKVDGLFGNYGRTWRRHYAGYSEAALLTLPRVTTETGITIEGPITEQVQALLYLSVYLDQFKRGWKHTSIYLLRDRSDEGGNQTFGFYKPDYTPRLAATWLHNLTTTLADKASSAPPGELNYSIASQPETVHDLLLQKSDGRFELVLWDERFTGGSDKVSVKLGPAFPSVNLFDPTLGTFPSQTFSHSSSIELTLSNHPVIIEIPAQARDQCPGAGEK